MATAARAGTGTTALVLLLGAAVFLNYVDRGAIGIAAPLLKSELQLTATQFGLIVSAFFWIYAPVQLFVGWLCDRFSVYRLMAGGVLLWAAATLLTGFAGGFVSLLVLRMMLGIGETIAFPGGSKIITRHVPPERRGLANAAMALGIALGPAAGTLAGGVILATLGWRAIFIVFGLLTLIWLAPWKLAVRDFEAGPAPPEERVPIRTLIGKWSLWSMSIAHGASNYVFYFILAWLPLYLVQSRGLSIAEMTLLATLGYAAQAVAALSFGAVSDWWTSSGRSEGSVRRWMMIAGQLLAGAAVLGLAYADSPGELAVRFDGVALNPRTQLADYIRSGWVAGLDPSSVRTVTINGNEAATARAAADGWKFDITVIRAGGQVYRLLTAAPTASDQLDATAQTVGGSFKLLSAREKASLKPLRIRVVTVKPGQTVGSISASMVGVDRKLELFRVLNALAPGATVSAGDKVKIITDS